MDTIKKGSRGELVKYLQNLLGISPDGIFGTITENAVKLFQSRNRLTVDGIVGETTWQRLIGTSSANKSAIEKYYLPTTEYIPGKYKCDYIVLHHTSGHDNPYSVVDGWKNDTIGRIATEFVIGGKNCRTGRNTYDGKIISVFPEGSQAYHIGVSGSSYMNLHSVGIEMCNMCWVKNGKTYVGEICQKDQIVTLDKPFRGYDQYHRYTDTQIASLKTLLEYISKRDNIDLHEGLYKWIKNEGAGAFEFHEDAYYGRTKGIITHANIRKDKFDVFPQPELMDMILTL